MRTLNLGLELGKANLESHEARRVGTEDERIGDCQNSGEWSLTEIVQLVWFLLRVGAETRFIFQHHVLFQNFCGCCSIECFCVRLRKDCFPLNRSIAEIRKTDHHLIQRRQEVCTKKCLCILTLLPPIPATREL